MFENKNVGTQHSALSAEPRALRSLTTTLVLQVRLIFAVLPRQKTPDSESDVIEFGLE